MDDLPDRWRILIAFFACFFAINVFPNYAKAPDNINTDQLILVNGNTLVAVSTPTYPKISILGAIIGGLNDLYWEVELDYPLLSKIINCESGWRNVCNAKSCNQGQGLGQIIPTTWKYVQTKIDIGNDPMDIEDNLRASIWLFENEGTDPWGYEGAKWGSFDCWGKYLDN